MTSLWSYIEQGGPIMYILLTLNIIGVAIIISKAFTLIKEKKQTVLRSEYILKRLRDNGSLDNSDQVTSLIQKEISSTMSDMEKGLNTVKIIATVSPLLGLLGTVLGVLVAFQVIAQAGMNDPAQFAGGISMALITTVGGLIVAIPHLIAHTYFLGMLDKIEGQIELEVLSSLHLKSASHK
jgi:biopolymer transport protein ExbB